MIRMCLNNMMNVYLLVYTICLVRLKCSSTTINSTGRNVTPQYLENLLNTNRFEEFAKILQIPNINLVKPSHRKTDLYILFSANGLDFGDILMRPGQVLNPDDHYDFNGIVNVSINTWKNGTVPYYITNTYTYNETIYIENEIEYNNRMLGPNINVRPYEDGDTDYVLFYKGGCGCYTNFGYVGGPQVISLLSVCLYQGSVSHELQHTLGIGHLVNRIDREDYIRVIHENIPEALVSQYVRYNPENFINIGPYDYYCVTGFPNKVLEFGIPAFEILQDGIDSSKVGADHYLTPTDIQRVKTIYR